MAKKIVPLRDAPRQDDAGAAEWKPAPRPTWMSDTEARLYDELVTTTRKLAKRGVPVSYSVIADVAEAMERAHREGRSALREIAAGIDTVRKVEREYRAAGKAHRDKVLDDGAVFFCVWAVVFALAAFATMLAGFNTGNRTWLYLAAFLAAVCAAFAVPLALALRR